MDWNIKASKFYAEIMDGLTAFFGLSDATEAELHQHLSGAGTMEQVKASAVAEMQTQFDGFKTQLQSLTEKVEGLTTALTEKEFEIGGLADQVAALTNEASEKDKTIAAHVATIKSLSANVALLKAGKDIGRETVPDASLELPRETAKQMGGNVMTTKQLLELFN